MEIATAESDDHVTVCGMTHLLISDHFEDHLLQTLQDVDKNFTSIYKAANDLLDVFQTKFPYEIIYFTLRDEVGVLIMFCKCSLKRILEKEDTKVSLNLSLVHLLAEIESKLLDLVKDFTHNVSCDQPNVSGRVPFNEMDDLLRMIAEAFCEPSPIYCSPMVTNYDIMMEFLDHCLKKMKLHLPVLFDPDWDEMLTVLRNYLKFLTKDRMWGDGSEKLLISVENVTYEMARYFFYFVMAINETSMHFDNETFDSDNMESRFLVGVLKALVLPLDNFSISTPLMSDKLAIGYVKCVQYSLLGLPNKEEIDDDAYFDKGDIRYLVKGPLMILHEGLSFLTHLLIGYHPKHFSEQEKLSNMRSDFQALARNIGSIVYSCLENRTEMRPELFDLYEKIEDMKERIFYNFWGVETKPGGMMHLLISDHFQTEDHLLQTLQDVDKNFTSIYKAAIALLDVFNTKFPGEDIYDTLREEVGVLIMFCKCSLKRLGCSLIMLYLSLVHLLAEIESNLLDLVEDLTHNVSCDEPNVSKRVPFNEMDDLLRMIAEAFCEPSPIYCSPLVTNYDLMMEFLDHCLQEMKLQHNYRVYRRDYSRIKLLKNYLKFLTKDRMCGDGSKKLMITVENVTYEMARYLFRLVMYTDETWLHFESEIFYLSNMESRFRFGVLKALVLPLDSFSISTPLMSDKLAVGYVKCIQDSLLGLPNKEEIDDDAYFDKGNIRYLEKGPLMILHEGLSFLMHLLMAYHHNSEQEKLSNMKSDFQALARNIGSIVYSCLENHTEMHHELFDLYEQEKLSNMRSDFQALARNIGSIVYSCLENRTEMHPELFDLYEKIEDMKIKIFYTFWGVETKSGGMMHLLISDHFQTEDHLLQTLQDVDKNFTSIYKAAIVLLDLLIPRFPLKEIYVTLRDEVGVLIMFCRCSLKRIFEKEDTKVKLNPSLVHLLAEIESNFLDLVKDFTRIVSCDEPKPVSFMAPIPFDAWDELGNVYKRVPFSEVHDMVRKIEEAFCEPSPIYNSPLVTNYDMMMEFLDHCLQDSKLHRHRFGQGEWTKNLTVLRNYLKFLTEDRMCGDGSEKLLIAVENVIYEVARYCFQLVMHKNKTSMHFENEIFFRGNMISTFRVGVLKALVLPLDSFSISTTPLMSDELAVCYVKYVQDCLLELTNKGKIDYKAYEYGIIHYLVKDQVMILHQGLSILTHLVITYHSEHNSEQEKLSNIRSDFQALARNIGSIVYSCLKNRTEMRPELLDLIENLEVMKEKIFYIFCCNVLVNAGRESPKQDQLGSLILLLQNLKEFIDSKTGLVVTWKDYTNLALLTVYLIQNNVRGGNQIGADEFPRTNFQLDVTLINHEELNQVLISAQVIAFNMACYSLLKRYGRFRWWELYLGDYDHVDLHMCVRILKAFMMSSTNPLTDKLLIAFAQSVKDCFIELLRIDEAFDSLNDEFKSLNGRILFMVRLLVSYSNEPEKLSHIKAGFQDLMREVGCEVLMCFINQLMGNAETKPLTTKVSSWIKKMNLIMDEIKKLLHLLHINKIEHESPKTNQLGSLNLLLENWKSLTECDNALMLTWKDQFQTIHDNLVLFKSFITSSSTGDKSQNLRRSMVAAGHVAEYLLTTFSYSPVQCRDLWILEFVKHVELIKEDVMKVNNKKSNEKEISYVEKDQSLVSPQPLLALTSTDVFVGFDAEMINIKERLASDLKQLRIISIIGMPGLGKTTLARKVYEDPFTINYFDVRAWCIVSQQYNTKELLCMILDCITVCTDETRRKSEEDLSLMVHQKLIGRRFLIVLDDIWEIDVFLYLKRFFPDDNQGSRIMLTSRSKEIGSEAQGQDQCVGDIIEPSMLTDEQSWDLLEQKVYNKGKFPPELCQIGKKIAKQCRGLPLAIVVVGGVLAREKQNREFWEQFTGNMSSYLACDSQSQFMAALELSYKHLPNHLKPMFLYFGVFPEDREILVDKLVLLWMAEGFVQNTKSTSLEIEAEKNLMNLIDRNLVMVSKRRVDGRVKACHVHDLLRDLCLAKAKEENFMQQLQVYNDVPDPIMYQRRLSVLLAADGGITSGHFHAYQDLPMFSIVPPIYSLLFFNVYPKTYSESKDIALAISSLKLLRVLEAGSFQIGQDILENDIIRLVHLRYACFVAYESKSIPSSISLLQSLETLIIEAKGTYGRVGIIVPETIWEMTKLRHLIIYGFPRFSVPMNSFILENLQTLSKPNIYAGEDEKLFRKVPNLKKLSCTFDYDKERLTEHETYQFPNFESISELESLNVSFFSDSAKLTGELKLPLTLKKLTIEGFMLEWSQISMLKTLPNLKFLKLKFKSVVGKVWDMGDDDVFTNLKILSLISLDIERWSASSRNFPTLEKLVIRSCRELQDISSDLGYIDTLQLIQVIHSHSSVVKMVQEIREEQEECGNDSLKFSINEK